MHRVSRRAFLLAGGLSLLGACVRPTETAKTGRLYAASIHPITSILHPIVSERAEVRTVIPNNASPHTYEVRPGDVAAVERSAALFYTSEDLDGWAMGLAAPHRIPVFDFIPGDFKLPWPEEETHAHDHDHAHEGLYDPHFWSDPLTVQAMLPGLVDAITAVDPDGAESYSQCADAFSKELLGLHDELTQQMDPFRGQKIVLFHPSWNYFLARYGVSVTGYIEPSAGKEATPRNLQTLIASIKADNVRAVFTEPQLASRPAEIVAETAGIRLAELDPLGGVEGRLTYSELIRYNAAILEGALR